MKRQIKISFFNRYGIIIETINVVLFIVLNKKKAHRNDRPSAKTNL
jgi:hypothetical protein